MTIPWGLPRRCAQSQGIIQSLRIETIDWNWSRSLGLCKNLELSQNSQILPSFAYFWVSLKSSCSHGDWELERWISHSYFSGKVETYWDNKPALCHSKSSRKFRPFCEFKPGQLSCHKGKTCRIKFTSQTCLFLHLHPQLAQGTKILFWWSWDLSHGASHENFWYQNYNSSKLQYFRVTENFSFFQI